ncbi:MAG: cation-transporting P-type ATPase [Anaerolineae bacterium]
MASDLKDFARFPISNVYESLKTSDEGLSQAEAETRLEQVGRNMIREVKGRPLYLRFLGHFTHLMAILLWIGGALAFIGQMPQLGWAIWAVVVINAIFSFAQEYKAERATAALKQLLPAYARVIRDGQEQRIAAEELVPGDVILLSEGDHISADARLVQEAELRVDQSTLSGESNPVRKIGDACVNGGLALVEMPNLVFAGTNVASGTGRAVVTATGMSTEFGKIAHLTQSVGEDTSPLQREIDRTTRIVTVMAVGIGILFFVLSILLVHRPLTEGFIFAVGMVVAFVPEGLLPTVTLSLAMGVQRMADRHALIKKLSSVETLGSCTVICTDKTGTLTQNEMTVRSVWLDGQALTVTGVGYEPQGSVEVNRDGGNSPSDSDIRTLATAAGLCNNARLIPPTESSARWTVLGDPTEAALRVLAPKANVDLDTVVRQTPRLREIPFDSRRKRMSTVHQGDGRERIVYVKGAPKEVLALCSRVMWHGQDRPIDEPLRQAVMAANDAYARDGLRVLAVARRILPADLPAYTSDTVEQDLTFLGLAAMMDPPRPEVAEAVGRCRRAGIRIIMVTGDYGLTAESIARRIGIIQGPQPRIVTGVELDAMDDDTLRDILKNEVIFARVAPEHKLRVVALLREMGHVVAVTGDGVNDAPALKRADIGVAMGITGTDVAKEAADMILTDDNFASIVNAIEEGRAVYANIKKFTTYIFTSNVPEAWPFIAQIMLGIPLPMTVMQVLAVDLGTDMLPALALGTEKPEPGVMDRPPRKTVDRLIDRRLLVRALLWLGSLETLLAFTAYFIMWWTNGYHDLMNLPRMDLLPYAERLATPTGYVYVLSTTIFFASVVCGQVGAAYACRTERASVFTHGMFSNRFLLLGIAFELSLACVLMYIPLFQEIFELGPLPWQYWVLIIFWAPIVFLAEEGRKAVMRWWERRPAHGARHRLPSATPSFRRR